jgi:hypothetical protein
MTHDNPELKPDPTTTDQQQPDIETHRMHGGSTPVEQPETQSHFSQASADGDEVEAHHMFSDERLKQAVTQVESALAGLRQLSTPPPDGDEVEAHHMYSDERLKQAVTPAPGVVAALGSLGGVCG